MKAMAAAKGKRPRAQLVVEEGDSYDFGEEDPVEDAPEEDVKIVNSKLLQRYSLVKTNYGLWGCYDGTDDNLTLFHTKAEASALVHDLVCGGSGFKDYYGGGRN
jgi:hypothetical protein